MPLLMQEGSGQGGVVPVILDGIAHLAFAKADRELGRPWGRLDLQIRHARDLPQDLSDVLRLLVQDIQVAPDDLDHDRGREAGEGLLDPLRQETVHREGRPRELRQNPSNSRLGRLRLGARQRLQVDLELAGMRTIGIITLRSPDTLGEPNSARAGCISAGAD